MTMREGWEQTALGKICTTVGGATIPGDGVPYVGLEHIDPGEHVVSRFGDTASVKSASTPFVDGDILFSKLRPYLNKVARTDTSGWCSNEALVYRALPDQTSQDFLFNVLRSPSTLRFAVDSSVGTRMPRTSAKKMADLAVLLPPVHEQQRIVDLMDAVDAAISAAQTEVDGVEAARTRLRDHYPRSCPHVPISQVLLSIDSGTSTKPVTGPGEEVNLLTLAAIRPGAFFPREIKSVGAAQLPDKSKLSDGDLLITRSNTPQRVGYVALARDVAPRTYIPDLVWKLVPNESQVSAEYLAELLSSPTYRRHITSSASGTNESMQKINKTNFRKLRIPLPTSTEQAEYLGPLLTLGDAQRAAQTALNRLRELRSSLLTVLLSGEHEIPETYDQFLTETTEVQAQ